MARPRKTDHDLPKGVYFRHGAYFQVVGSKWHRIGTDRQVAMTAPHSREVKPRTEPLRATILDFTKRLITTARQNAKGRRQIPFSLTSEDAETLLEQARWRCSVTGATFSLEKINGKRPFAPSIDRIDSEKGYTLSNCRVVCVATNYAMNVWGDEVLLTLIHHAKRKYVIRQSPKL
jgi:hypothetical protein